MTYNTWIKSFLLLISLSFFTACLSVKPGGGKSGKKLYETFFVGEEGTQYFIKPLSFVDENKDELKLDVTFRYKTTVEGDAIVNVSFPSDKVFKTLDSLVINNNHSQTVAITDMEFLFAERSKNIYTCRFSSEVDLVEVKQLFEASSWELSLYKNNQQVQYMPAKHTAKNIEKINYEIFALF